jgi:hypothetical protein
LTGHSPAHAFRNVVRAFREALGCITQAHIATADLTTKIEAGPIYPINVGAIEPILLRVNSGNPGVGISVGQSVECVQTGSPRRQERFEAIIVDYFYALSTSEGNEILAFHWTPEPPDPNQQTFPHLHVGAVNLDANSPIRPGTFHKMHIPTSHVTVEAIIRLAITELNVRPSRADWEEVLTRTERTRARMFRDMQ